MPNYAAIFPGQASQFAGMGKDAYDQFPEARAVFNAADEALGFRLSRLCFEGPEADLQLTENTQPAILTTSYALYMVLEARGFTPAAAAGHSLGEYTAWVAAGTLDFADAVRLVQRRGRYMQAAVPPGVGAMAAVLGASIQEIEQACADAAQGEVVMPANLNCPGQVVISGHAPAVMRAVRLLAERGRGQATLLPVSAPFHCALMVPAAERLDADLAATEFRDPRFPVLTNVDAAPATTAAAAREALARQVTQPVRWHEAMLRLRDLGVDACVEIGPKTVLRGLMKRIDRAMPVANVGDVASVVAFAGAEAMARV
jgi:[acyl-carrier-protein] S-malonyltransferase